MFRIIWSFILASIMLSACVPPSKEVNSKVNFDIKNPQVQRLIDFQDQTLIDSLLPFFSSQDANDRYLAARAMASIKDKSVSQQLGNLLEDPNMNIRAVAAYALGQIGEESNTELLIGAFIDQDTLDVDNALNAQLLEALGKTSNEAIMNNIASVESYRMDDTLLLLGQVRSLYRFGLNGYKSQEATDAALKYALDRQYPDNVRLIAASYLARNNGLDISLRKEELLRQIRREEDTNIRMNLALGLRNLSSETDIITDILNIYNSEKDYRVKVYIIKALSYFPYIQVIEPIMEMVKDPNIHVSITAAQYLVDKGNRNDAYLYRELINEDMPWQTKSKVYEAVLRNVPIYYTKIKNSLSEKIQEEIEASEDAYVKVSLIKALSQDPYQYKKLIDINSKVNQTVLKTAIAEGFYSQLTSPDFIKAFGGGYVSIARTMVDTLLVDAKKGDVGVIYYLSQILKIDSYKWNEMIKDTSWQEEILASMKLPRDIESYNEFQEAISSINGTTFNKKRPEYNHPIDWSLVNTISDSSRIVMKTSKGNITIRLFPEHAPGSVANFLELCQSDYYDGKVFHRVVPNFVIQGGCPIGDGFGALDYTIRSELGPKYYDDEGYIGMASAGNNTEGVQFFITHSPTPHLDGRYTIFGKVTNGMDVVHDIQIGDKIIDAILTYE